VKSIFEITLLLISVVVLPIALWVFFCDCYYLILSLWGFKKAQRDYEIIEDKTRFLILVAAHNEEAVLESSYENWKEIDYDSNLFRIVIVNDNSTDSTGELCEKMGVDHVDTIEGKFEREGVGKPAGIQYALRELGFEHIIENYDLVMVLDADNHVDSRILKEVNAQWQKYKPEAIQTYLCSKNPNSSMMARGYATAYWMSNRFFQLAKYRLGLFNAIGGTGFAVSTQWLVGTGGFAYKSLTEDLEMTIEIVKSGGKVLWNHFTRIYDEKPDTLKISLRQRVRWSQGHWFVAFNNLGALLRCIWKDRRNAPKYLDQIIYLYGMGRSVMVFLLIIQIAAIVFLSHVLQTDFVVFSVVWITLKHIILIFLPVTVARIIFAIYSYVFVISFALYTDGDKGSYPKTLLAVLYMSFTYLYAQAIGLFKWKQQGVWVKTPHKYTSKTIEEPELFSVPQESHREQHESSQV